MVSVPLHASVSQHQQEQQGIRAFSSCIYGPVHQITRLDDDCFPAGPSSHIVDNPSSFEDCLCVLQVCDGGALGQPLMGPNTSSTDPHVNRLLLRFSLSTMRLILPRQVLEQLASLQGTLIAWTTSGIIRAHHRSLQARAAMVKDLVVQAFCGRLRLLWCCYISARARIGRPAQVQLRSCAAYVISTSTDVRGTTNNTMCPAITTRPARRPIHPLMVAKRPRR
jgi:hypothetical protein